MNEWWTGVAAIAGTMMVYAASKRMYRRFPAPLMLPIVTGTIVIILFLLISGIPYNAYMTGGQWIESLLGPAVVALACPLYEQRHLLKRYSVPILSGIGTGAVIGIISGLVFTRAAGASKEWAAAVLPKSVTTPVAMDITTTLGGDAPLAAMFVMVAGIGGVVVHAQVMKAVGVTDPVAKGIGMGSAAHAIGTAKSLENSETEGAVSSVAMTVSAVIVAFLAPLAGNLFL
ncbi:LrgB family protein [Marinococcus halophilus]|uniref:LrgB family protein n=1 Tax=Marinococcus halophilus TaxID=1371 RepID=A0A510YB32_MARHA|nr:LrgB family protein [Marinococcus halophilus]GEK59577.1 hypothetical protein MHA01_24820 [Marinococcus halophilus]